MSYYKHFDALEVAHNFHTKLAFAVNSQVQLWASRLSISSIEVTFFHAYIFYQHRVSALYILIDAPTLPLIEVGANYKVRVERQ